MPKGKKLLVPPSPSSQHSDDEVEDQTEELPDIDQQDEDANLADVKKRGKGRGKSTKGAKAKSSAKTDSSLATAESDDEDDNDTGDKKRKTPDAFFFEEDVEDQLAKWFSEHPEFYDKSNKGYYNKDRKSRLLTELARDLNTSAKKIEGWFRNQRTTFGRLMKGATKSGSAAPKRTPRQEWQFKSFQFLTSYINPRTYTKESSSTTPDVDEDVAGAEGEEEGPTPPGKKSKKNTPAKDVAQVLQDFLERPRGSDTVARQLVSQKGGKSAKQSFGDFLSTMTQLVPDERWVNFTRESLRLVNEYVYGIPPPPVQTPTQPTVFQGQWTPRGTNWFMTGPQPAVRPSQQQQQQQQPQAGPSGLTPFINYMDDGSQN